jgi:hypothetical protein
MLGLQLPKYGLEAFTKKFGSARFPDAFNYRLFLQHLNQNEAGDFPQNELEGHAALAAAVACTSTSISPSAAAASPTSHMSHAHSF